MSKVPLIRVFLSSPGDVIEERQIVQEVVESLPNRPAFREKVAFNVIAWDKPGAGTAMRATLTPQEAINKGLPRPSECDIVIVIFWARMGTPFTLDNQDYLSGTHWELLDAIRADHRRTIIYRRVEKKRFKVSDTEGQRQYKILEAFFRSDLFYDSNKDAIKRGLNIYQTPDNFRKQFETHFEELVIELLGIHLETLTQPEKSEASRFAKKRLILIAGALLLISTSLLFIVQNNKTINCSDLPTPIISPSVFGMVTAGSQIPVHKEPLVETEILTELKMNQSVQVMAGPECRVGRRWFSVDYGGLRPGWIEDIQVQDAKFKYQMEPVNLTTLSDTTACSYRFFFGSEQGCPSGETTEVQAAYQPYEKGFMIWRSDPDEFYVFVSGGAMFVYNSSFIETIPNNPRVDTPPTGLVKPVSGFGRIWSYFDRLPDQLGWATTNEVGYKSRIQYVDLESTPREDKILFYITLPDEQVVAVGVGKARYWRYAKQT